MRLTISAILPFQSVEKMTIKWHVKKFKDINLQRKVRNSSMRSRMKSKKTIRLASEKKKRSKGQSCRNLLTNMAARLSNSKMS